MSCCRNVTRKLMGTFDLSVSSCSSHRCISLVKLMTIEFITSGADGGAVFSLEMSNGGKDDLGELIWYKATCNNAFNIDSENVIVRAGQCDGYYYRVCYDAESSTATQGVTEVFTSLKTI